MVNFTQLETSVYNKALDHCFSEYSTDALELSKDLNISVNVVKGVLGSLTKKGMITVDQGENCFPIIKGSEVFSFGWDNYDDSELQSFKIMKVRTSQTTQQAIEMIETVLGCIEDSYHWIGDNSHRLDKVDTVAYINNKVLSQKHLKTRYYEDNSRLCIDLGLSGRNCLHINLMH